MGMVTINSARALVAFHEGCVLKAKPDAKGKWEIGYGDDRATPGQVCTQEGAEQGLTDLLDLATRRAVLDVGPSTWSVLGVVRQAVLIDMAYELGGAGLAAFHDLIAAVRARNWQGAVHAMQDSKWAHQVPSRAMMNEKMMFTGQWPTL